MKIKEWNCRKVMLWRSLSSIAIAWLVDSLQTVCFNEEYYGICLASEERTNGEELERPYGPFLRAPSRNNPGLAGDRWLRGSSLESSDSNFGKNAGYDGEEVLPNGGENHSLSNKGKCVSQGLISINPTSHALPPLLPNMKENPLFKEGLAGDSHNKESDEDPGITILEQKRRRKNNYLEVNLNNPVLDYEPMHDDPKMGLQWALPYHENSPNSTWDSWDYNLLADLFNEEDHGQIMKIPLTAHGRRIECTGFMTRRVFTRSEVGFLKLNIDAAIFEDQGKAGLGLVIRNDLGSFVAARVVTVQGIVDPLLAETLGVREALSWIKSKFLEVQTIEMDALLV
ncbi:unnamed protein product [Fraxinus pennsylvanica]|uniref:RNase H type-1 domain-containing protein n=1 Tax=Fraxinus pennsylvanica TaxID=56036 RepID=A0AAD1ZXD7_9LAMI|nr:unnamed protein product [Fraxinus pennsylvanica]